MPAHHTQHLRVPCCHHQPSPHPHPRRRGDHKRPSQRTQTTAPHPHLPALPTPTRHRCYRSSPSMSSSMDRHTTIPLPPVPASTTQIMGTPRIGQQAAQPPARPIQRHPSHPRADPSLHPNNRDPGPGRPLAQPNHLAIKIRPPVMAPHPRIQPQRDPRLNAKSPQRRPTPGRWFTPTAGTSTSHCGTTPMPSEDAHPLLAHSAKFAKPRHHSHMRSHQYHAAYPRTGDTPLAVRFAENATWPRRQPAGVVHRLRNGHAARFDLTEN